ncbi:MAG: alpha/beta fold hydrolase [Acidobacteriales bacterium]|nr:alpha/beta fold hydrolase [Terriglobales bacterium]
MEELWTEVQGCPVRYLKCGNGPPLVLVHGLLGSAFCWRCNLAQLGAIRTVYALDLPGVGYSGRIYEPECSVRTNAERLLAFMRGCDLERADLLGNSHGGAIAMMAAAIDPQRIARLLLVAPVHPWMDDRRFLLSVAASPVGRMLMRMVAPQLGLLHGYFLRRMYGDPRRIKPGTVEGYSAPVRIPGTVDHLIAMVRCWKNDMQDLARVLPQLRSIPTFLMWGSSDRAVNPNSAVRLQQAFEDCQLEIFPGAGHLPYEEFPEEFNHRVLEFLEQKSAAGV